MRDKTVLLVEDDLVDTMNVKRAFKDLKITNQLDCVQNGEEALEYLQNANNQWPCLILLDLNMPRMNGIEFLSEIRNDDTLKRLPVVVLTTSDDEKDRLDSYDFGVSGYMIKPIDYKKFVEVIKAIKLFWTLSETPYDS